ncbi:hypothetical protein BDZ89DRAFT_1134688 [Hymenopellis radicata]|nr:hypothetical protein BDZ89DRAFT_1134688 [Hymenopellis radicata]
MSTSSIGRLPANPFLELHIRERVPVAVLAKGIQYLRPFRAAMTQTLSRRKEIFLESLLGEMWVSFAVNELKGRTEAETDPIRMVFTHVLYSMALREDIPMEEWALPQFPVPAFGFTPGQERLISFNRRSESKEERHKRRQRNRLAEWRQNHWESYGFVHLPNSFRFSDLRRHIFNLKRSGRYFSDSESPESGSESSESGSESESESSKSGSSVDGNDLELEMELDEEHLRL